MISLVHDFLVDADDNVGSWFAWANSVFAQTILLLAETKPHLIFGKEAAPYVLE